MIIDCIADLHGFYPELEGGDLLIVAGDLTAKDTLECYRKWYQWLARCKYSKIIIVCGNHDNRIQQKGFPPMPKEFNCEYLCDSGTEFEYEEPVRNLFDPHDKSLIFRKKLKIWGSPWTKTFEGMNPHCKAFTVDTEEELVEKWRRIPNELDILITHSPPYSILDKVAYINYGEEEAEHVGSHSLLYYSRMQQPRLHVFGHIHEAYGKEIDEGITTYVNASHVNERYQPVNKPIRIIL